jgi:hypothetical protein
MSDMEDIVTVDLPKTIVPSIRVSFVTKGVIKHYIIDACDMERVQVYRWYITSDGYMETGIDKKNVRLHRFLLNVTDRKQCVDHINGQKLDNRKANLRLCTQRQNCQNRQTRCNSSSFYKGVSWDRSNNKWRARIYISGNPKFLGNFTDNEEAARAYDKAAREYFGEFACVNFPLDGEQPCHRSIDTSSNSSDSQH